MKPPIKLLLALPHLGGGGAERVFALLAQHLDPTRFEIHLALITPDQPGSPSLPPHITLHRLHLRRIRYAALPLLRLIRTLQPRIVLSGMAHLNFLILLLKPLLPRRTRLLVRQNTTASAAATRLFTRLAYRHLYPRADKVICQSKSMAEDLIQHFNLPAENLIVLRNPIAPPQPLSHPPPSPHAPPSLLLVGRLSPEKGADLLLHALTRVRQTHPQVKLTFLGIGPQESALKTLADALNLTESIHFAGHTDPTPHFAASTLFVLPSRYEGIPNALLEAAAAGLPIVATPASAGLTELLQNHPGCWLTPHITAESLAETIQTALVTLASTNTRFQHAFLDPFQLQPAIAAYTHLLETESRIRLALLIPTLDQIGGAERQVLELARELAQHNWHITLIALSGTGRTVAAELAQTNVAYLSLGMRKAWIDPRGWLRYLRWHRRHRPDILHSHLPHATFFARLSRLVAPVPILIDTIHTSATGPFTQRFTYRLTHSLTSHLTCVSQAVAQAVRDAKIAPNPTVLPNGIPIQTLQSAFSNLGTDMGAPYLAPEMWDSRMQKSNPVEVGTPFRWLSIGRLAPVKDYPTLLRAFAILPGNPKLTIAGTGPDAAPLQTLSNSLGIVARVHFAGFHPDIQPLLAQADAFVLASLWEGLPISVLEASAAALPIVATDASGTRETLIPGKTGLLVPVADTNALARAMTEIMQLPAEARQQMGQSGRAFAAANFALPQIADRWRHLYQSLLKPEEKSCPPQADTPLTAGPETTATASEPAPRQRTTGPPPTAPQPATPPVPDPRS